MKKNKKVRWDPIVARIADDKVKNKNGVNTNNSVVLSKSKINWISASQRRRSPEEFQAYLQMLFDCDGPVVKYQNPDAWGVYPPKKKRTNLIGS